MSAKRHKSRLFGSFLIPVAITVLTLLGPLLMRANPTTIDLSSRLQPPDLKHWAGTDEVGRDLFARIIYGGRASVLAGVGIVLLGLLGGTALGSVSGYSGGLVDALVMRIVDALMSLPSLVIALALTAALGPDLTNVAIALGILNIPTYARVARGQTLQLRHSAYLEASKLMGAPWWHQVRFNVFPNILPPLVVYAAGNIGPAILAAASLSFIGLGAQPPAAEWGAIINSGRPYLLTHWWYSVLPGVALAISVVGFNFLGDRMRDLLDPREL
jgi:peptide/nickel transport system permease protein